MCRSPGLQCTEWPGEVARLLSSLVSGLMPFPQGGVSSVETPLVLMGMMSLLAQQVVVK